MSDEPNPKGPAPGGHTPLWRYAAAGLVAVLLWTALFGVFGGPEPRELSYTRFKAMVEGDRIEEVTFRGPEVRGRLLPAPDEGAEEGKGEGRAAPPGEPFVAVLPDPEDPQLLDLLEDKGVEINAERTGGTWWQQALVGMLPWLLLIGIFFYASWRMQQRMAGGGGQGGLFGFAKSKARRFREERTRTTLDDVAGVENAKRDLAEIIDFLSDPERYWSLGAKTPKGVLLMGPPGTGKTLLARAVAGEADVPFYTISGSEFIEMFVGVGAARVRDMFESAKKEAPAVIFIDEIDSVGRSRGAGLGGGHDEREQTLNQILSEMDGFSPHENLVVLAATNRPDVLDQALLRPGRFDRKVVLELPDREARQRILEVHTRRVPLAEDVDLGEVAARTIGFSGADLENLVNEAALLAGRRKADAVNREMIDNARDKLVLGAEREQGLSDEERRLVAHHECGHALMAWLLPEADPPDKVTVIPRGRALGATEQLPDEERYNLRRAYLLDRIGVMLGGRVAEQVIFGDVTTGAEADLEQATRMARRMITRWGMSEALGPVSLRQGDEHVFLGRELAQQSDFSEQTAAVIDREIHELLVRVEARDRELIERHRETLERMAKRLMEAETLGKDELAEILGDVPQAEGHAEEPEPRAAAG